MCSRLIVLAAVALLSACDRGLTEPTPLVVGRFTMAPGEVLSVGPSQTRLEFVAVLSDSRCPIDAVCVSAGSAVVRIRATTTMGVTDVDLSTGGGRPGLGTFPGGVLELLELQPAPAASQPIALRDYRATVRLTI